MRHCICRRSDSHAVPSAAPQYPVFHQCLVLHAAVAVALADATVPVLLSTAARVVEKRRL